MRGVGSPQGQVGKNESRYRPKFDMFMAPELQPFAFYLPMPARHIPALNSSSHVYLERRNHKATLSSDVYGRRHQNIGHIKTEATFRDSLVHNVYTNCIQNSLLLAPYHYC